MRGIEKVVRFVINEDMLDCDPILEQATARMNRGGGVREVRGG